MSCATLWIQSGLSLLERAAGDAEHSATVRIKMQRQVQQLVRIVNDLLDVARFTRGSCELVREAVDLRDVIEMALETARPLVEQRRQDAQFVAPSLPVIVDGDFARLTQVVANLINNAAKYTQTEGRIRVYLDVCDDWALVQVVDNGRGIPHEALPHVFNLFMQADPSRTREYDGLGLGLNIVKRLTEMHGGRVAVYSEGPGRGSRFEIALPLSVGTTKAVQPLLSGAPDADSSSRPGRCRRILIVDDNAESADMLGALLTFEGFQVELAPDAPSALQRIDGIAPDAVLLDIGLPGMDGFELARRLRRRSPQRRTLLIAVSGWGAPRDRELSRAAGIDHHLVKPVDTAALIELLNGGHGHTAAQPIASDHFG